MNANVEPRRGDFLDQFDAHQRRLVVDVFTDAADGVTDPAEVLAAVRRELQRRCARAALEGGDLRAEQRLRADVTRIIYRDTDAAWEFADKVIEREAAR